MNDEPRVNYLSGVELESPRPQTWQENLVGAVIASVVVGIVCWIMFGG